MISYAISQEKTTPVGLGLADRVNPTQNVRRVVAMAVRRCMNRLRRPIVTALSVTYPTSASPVTSPRVLTGTMEAVKNKYVLAFSAGVFLYVGVEAAIYVWMPTLLASYRGRATWLAAYGISIFFALRAAGRFLGASMLMRWRWHAAVAVLSGAILACFAFSVAGGVEWAAYLLPASGLLMAVIYRPSIRKALVASRKASPAPRPA
jgi:fucose permease